MNDSIYGRLHFQDGSTFENTKPLSQLEQALELLADLSKTPPNTSSINDWAPITECIRRGTIFSLTAKTPALKASIRFDSNEPFSGSYEINARHRYERGNVLKVSAINEKGLLRIKYAMLKSFPIRYEIVTVANDRQQTECIWLIGIASVRESNSETLQS